MVERVVKVEAESAARGNTDSLRSRGRTGVAGNIWGRDILDGGVVDWLANSSAGSRGSSNNFMPDVCRITVSL